MDGPIIPRETIRARAQRHHAAGIPLSACALPRHSEAYKTHAAEYARLDALAKAAPVAHAAPAARRCVAAAQVACMGEP